MNLFPIRCRRTRARLPSIAPHQLSLSQSVVLDRAHHLIACCALIQTQAWQVEGIDRKNVAMRARRWTGWNITIAPCAVLSRLAYDACAFCNFVLASRYIVRD